MIRAAAAVFWACATTAVAQAPSFSLPLDCDYGTDCFVQNYLDRTPGPGAGDFTCGPLTYDGHEGTDIRIVDRRAMLSGVEVRAAAGGRVLGTRDGMADIPIDAPDAPAIDGRECGNGVLIDHGDGWRTQYCHMMQGSVAVAPGDRVTRGQALGRVGLSGETQFPHVHFSVRFQGQEIDPFGSAAPACADPAANPPPAAVTGTEGSLWDKPLAYIPGAILNLGIGTTMPDFEAVKTGLVMPAAIKADQDALVLWVYLFGVREGDELQLSLRGRDGPLLERRETLSRTQAQIYRAAGRRAGAAPWPAGPLRGEATLVRDGRIVSRRAVTAAIAAAPP